MLKDLVARFMILFVAFLFVSPVTAHEGDPKVDDRLPRYEGPSYRRAIDLQGSPASQAAGSFSSSGILLRSWLTLPEFGTHATGNDCWGYTSPSGREYALMGLQKGTGFVEITNPDNAQIIDVLTGPTSLWRDIKVYQQFAYAVSEAGSGIQVFDLGQIDSGVVSLANTVTVGGTFATHNVAINEDSGFLYRCGGGSAGLRIYDLTDPTTPAFVSSWSDRYIHDAQAVTFTSGPNAGKEIVFGCGGLNGGFVQTSLIVLDVTDKQNIQTLSITTYAASGYSHQGWLSPDKRFFYLGDELDEDNGLTSVTITRVFDVQNLSNPSLVTTFTNGSGAIDHNVYTKGNLIFEANYQSGLRVYDATNALNPVEVAFFDTFPAGDLPNFNGLWNSYPFFPSGTIIGSDFERGLFVWTIAAGVPGGPVPAVTEWGVLVMGLMLLVAASVIIKRRRPVQA